MKLTDKQEARAKKIERTIREFLPHYIFSTPTMSNTYIPSLAQALAIEYKESGD